MEAGWGPSRCSRREEKWENVAVMCPHVLWDEKAKTFRMWYSGGEQNEPNAIGYATSRDGDTWEKSKDNPIFRPDPKTEWEKDRVTACQVIPPRRLVLDVLHRFPGRASCPDRRRAQQGRGDELAAEPGQPDHSHRHRKMGP